MNNKTNDFRVVRDYALRSPIARQYFFLVAVLATSVLLLWGPEVARGSGGKQASAVDFLIFWRPSRLPYSAIFLPGCRWTTRMPT